MLPVSPRAQAPLLKGHPFVAAFRCQTRGSNNVQCFGRMFRDGAGRTRVDNSLATGEAIRIIGDPSTLTFVFLDLNQKLMQKEEHGPVFAEWLFKRVAATYTDDHRSIQGIECVRVAFRNIIPGTSVGEDVGEAWISKLEGIVMKDDNPKDGWTWGVTEIDLREPDPGTFEIPKGFRKARDDQ